MSQPRVIPVEKTIQQQFEDAVYYLEKNYGLDTKTLAIALVVILFTLVLLKKLLSFGSRNKILLVGLPDAGKTLIFSRLIGEKYVDTVTSIKTNESQLKIGRKLLNLIDIPGFFRLREKCLEDNMKGTLAIIYVLDSATFSSEARQAADYLYNLISDDYVKANSIPILIACNKQDLPLAKTLSVIKKQLEKELGALRKAKLGDYALSSNDKKIKELIQIFGHPDENEFTFKRLRNRIEFINCSAKGDDSNNLNELYI